MARQARRVQAPPRRLRRRELVAAWALHRGDPGARARRARAGRGGALVARPSRADPFAGVVARRLPDRLSERPLAACRGGGRLGRPPAARQRRSDPSGMAARVSAQAHLCRSPRADRHGRPGHRSPALAIPARRSGPSAGLDRRWAAARGADGRVAAHPVGTRAAARRAPVRRGRAGHRDGGRAVGRLGRGRGPRQRRAQPDRLGLAARGPPASPAPVRGRRQLHRPELVAGRALAARRLARGRPMGVPALGAGAQARRGGAASRATSIRAATARSRSRASAAGAARADRTRNDEGPPKRALAKNDIRGLAPPDPRGASASGRARRGGPTSFRPCRPCRPACRRRRPSRASRR